VYHLFVIEAPQRDELQAHLWEQGISTGVHYPIPIHLQPAYGALGSQGAFPVTEQCAKRILSLPMYPGITPAAIEKTANAVRSFYDG
jgi:dTDP-4-amino-4,6-dideoxygalactose transaminase